MNPKNDGGPASAVPLKFVPYQGTTEVEYETTGLTLRDHFATAAMEGDWASQSEDCGCFGLTMRQCEFELRAGLYYRMADAMLKAREA
jgi:hypothetical protein